MTTRCVACRKPIKRGQLFCPDCCEKRAPTSSRRRERRRLGRLLKLILSLPLLTFSEQPKIVVTEDTWNALRHTILTDPETQSRFTEAAASLKITPTVPVNDWIVNMDLLTAKSIIREMAVRGASRPGRDKGIVFDIPRRLLVLSSPLLGTLVMALVLLGLALLIIG